MKILIKPGAPNVIDRSIQFVTHGKGSHAAFLRCDGVTIHEATWPRLRDRPVTPKDRRTFEVYDLEGVSLFEHTRFERLFDANLHRGIEYSIGDLIRYLFNLPCRDEHHTFCSRYVMHCIRDVMHPLQFPLVRLPHGDWCSPRDLRISPRLILDPAPWRIE